MKALMTAKGREQAREMLTAYLGYPPPLALSEQTTAELLMIYAAVQAGLRTPEWGMRCWSLSPWTARVSGGRFSVSRYGGGGGRGEKQLTEEP